MGKFAIECPKCGVVNTASTGLFAKTLIQCGGCGSEINTKTSRIVTKICPYCEKTFAYDQAKAKDRHCPSCGEKIDASRIATTSSSSKFVSINCPQCECNIEVDATKEVGECPLCGLEIDIQKEISKQNLVKNSKPSTIQYNGDNNTLIWKHPIENFNLGSYLYVDESQEALFFMSGKALDLFGPGRHVLKTENIPYLRSLYKDATNPEGPFPAKVYFFNKEVVFGCPWGTDKRVTYTDPASGLDFTIGACGEFKVQIADSRKLLLKVVGAGDGLKKEIWDEDGDGASSVRDESLMDFIMAPLQMIVKSNLASVIDDNGFSIFNMDRHMEEISTLIGQKLSAELETYGLTVPKFYITRFSLPEDEPNFKQLKALNARGGLGRITRSLEDEEEDHRIRREMKNIDLDAYRVASEGKAKGVAMAAQGYSQKDMIDADVQKAYAASMGQMGSNLGGGGNGGGGGGIASDMLGMMMASKLASTAMSSMDNMQMGGAPAAQGNAEAAPAAVGWKCACGATNTGAFCPSCGAKKPEQWTCSCGATNSGKFCPNCGAQKPEAWTCSCGAKNTGKFCQNCGAPQGSSNGWDCACGHKGNTGKFCQNCGAPQKTDDTWDCSCGCTGIKGKFCTECGAARPEA